MKKSCLTSFIGVGVLLFCSSGLAVAGNVSATKHNLSALGPGTIKATVEQKVCVFCHTPHLASPDTPLWNHALPVGETYDPYTSSTLVAVPGQPNGSSKLCLSCHDGTVALGSVLNLPGNNRTAGHFGNEAGVIAGLEATLTGSSSALLGTDLRDDHPVSFVYDTTLATQNGELVLPSALSGSVKPDSFGYLQCTSCHDPHTEVNPKFLRLASTDASGYGAQLCRTCHDKKYWSTVSNQPHRESVAEWNGAGTNPWFQEGHNLPNSSNSTPKANACFSCHQPHNGGGGKTLLARDGEQQVCLACHNGNVATKNIESSMGKLYGHPQLTTDGVHNSARDAVSGTVRETQANLNNRHAECQDCHNPHAVSAGVSPNIGDVGGTNNFASNVLKGVWGVEPSWPGNWGMLNDTDYTVVDDVQYQYQLCLKCHSSYAYGFTPPADPSGNVAGGQYSDQAQEFNPNNESYHPVVEPGKNDFQMIVNGLPIDYSSSLINGMAPNSTMTCADCHSDDEYTGMPGSTVPKGPHGSNEWPILSGTWTEESGGDGFNSSVVCFKCHKAEVYAFGAGPATGPETTGFSGCKDGEPCVVGLDTRRNLHRMHMGFGLFTGAVPNVGCMACHSAVPHGMQRRALLVIGRGVKDPAPYLRHERTPAGGGPDYGLHSDKLPEMESVPSGNWKRSDCHTGYFCY